MPAWPTTKMKPTGTTIGTSTSNPNETQSASELRNTIHEARSATDRPANALVATAASGRRRNAAASAMLDTTPATAAPMYVTGRSSEP